jgi:phosphopantothenoylcysteine decarboxylase/phosphopantothenate--cysteine ligase
VIVGFAAETGDPERSVLDLGRAKLQRKGCDLLVVNDVSGDRAFGQPDNEVVILGRDGSEREVPLSAKAEVADAVWDEVVRILPKG